MASNLKIFTWFYRWGGLTQSSNFGLFVRRTRRFLPTIESDNIIAQLPLKTLPAPYEHRPDPQSCYPLRSIHPASQRLAS